MRCRTYEIYTNLTFFSSYIMLTSYCLCKRTLHINRAWVTYNQQHKLSILFWIKLVIHLPFSGAYVGSTIPTASRQLRIPHPPLEEVPPVVWVG